MSEALGAALAAMARQAVIEAFRDDLTPARRGLLRIEYNRLVVLLGKARLQEIRGERETAITRLSSEIDSWQESKDDWADSDLILDLRKLVKDTVYGLKGGDHVESGEED